MKKLITSVLLPLCLVVLSSVASADYYTRDSGEVIFVPDGYNTAPFSLDYNIRGMSPDGTFPGQPILERVHQALDTLEALEDALAAPTPPVDSEPECREWDDLVTGNIPVCEGSGPPTVVEPDPEPEPEPTCREWDALLPGGSTLPICPR